MIGVPLRESDTMLCSHNCLPTVRLWESRPLMVPVVESELVDAARAGRCEAVEYSQLRVIEVWQPECSAAIIRLDFLFAHSDGLPCRRHWDDGRPRAVLTSPVRARTRPARAAGHGRMKLLAHIPHGRRASERLAEVCLCYTRTSSSRPRLGSLRPSTRPCTGAPAATPAALPTPANSNPSASLHSICISPASVAPAASF